MYAYDTWAMTRDEEKLYMFEMKVLRKFYVIQFNNVEQKGEIKTNTQIYQLYKKYLIH